MSFFKALDRIEAAKALSAEAAPTIQATDSTLPLYHWTRGTEATTASTKPGFGWQQGELVEALVEEAIAPQEAPQLIAPLQKPVVDSLANAPIWISRVNGEIVQSFKKPGFSYREATPEEADLVLAPKLAEDTPLVVEATPEANGFSLSNIAAAFEAARFTKEEAVEEAALIASMLEADPELVRVLSESPVPLNANQLLAASMAKQGKSFVLTGAAGTGKTTAQAATIDILDKEACFDTHDFKYIGTKPSVAVVAFTKVAVRNIQKAIRKNERIAHYAEHCMTIHALLEFEPVTEERTDDTGLAYDVKIFRPQRHRYEPLGITHLIIEEASMVGLDLFKLLADALLPGVQIIYLGDINQLQPIFSNPILAYALVKLPVIELTRVYRQALDNPIIYNAHQVLKGEPIKSSKDGRVSVVTGTSLVQVGQLKMASAIKQNLRTLYDKGFYDPEEDQILLPWNKQFLGTKAINEAVASFLGADRQVLVQQVKAGRATWWLAIGDKILSDKRMGVITHIQDNPRYIGGSTAPAGFYTRDGTPILGLGATVDFDATIPADEINYEDFDMGLVETEEGARAASHVITLQWLDTDNSSSTLSTSGDFADSKFDFGYAMTVHKAQGSEYRKVFMAIHQDHLGFLSRELMYTALTRAREEFILFAKEPLVAAACLKQEVKGTSLQDKIEYFTSGALADLDQVQVEFPKEAA